MVYFVLCHVTKYSEYYMLNVSSSRNQGAVLGNQGKFLAWRMFEEKQLLDESNDALHKFMLIQKIFKNNVYTNLY